jgi:DNA helicase HerA-like ATPase
MISRHEGRLIVLVDEAHRVTADPDAGQVLEQLVRQARKYGTGVWMASQSLDDFVRTDLGRVLAATAATKLVLGVEATVAEDARAAFGLSQQELAALSPRFKAGRGVLISGHERAVVDVVAGEHLMPLVSSGPAVSSQPAPAAGAA